MNRQKSLNIYGKEKAKATTIPYEIFVEKFKNQAKLHKTNKL